jgi:hypothetical protein
VGMIRVWVAVLPADWRSCWSMAQAGAGRRRLASSAGRYLRNQLLAICIDHTKESSSHRHKACQYR